MARDLPRGIRRAVDRVLFRLTAATATLLLLGVAACGGPEREIALLRGETMSSTWSVQLSLEKDRRLAEADLAGLHAAIQAELDRIEAEMSTYREDSAISRFNASTETTWFPVSEGFAAVTSTALDVGRKSEGLYDITVGPLVDLWGFGPGPNHGRKTVPSDAEIEAARALVGQAQLEVRRDPPAVRKTEPAVRIDLSSIAQGHGVDLVGALLDARGFEAWFVELSGEIRTKGEKAKGTPWRVGIERPSAGPREGLRVLDLKNAAIATSGDYRNFFDVGGQRFAHTIDPRTGRPAAQTAASVSVIAATCAEADAWATALMALGAESGFRVADREDIAALFLLPKQDGAFEEKPTPAFHRFGRAPQ